MLMRNAVSNKNHKARMTTKIPIVNCLKKTVILIPIKSIWQNEIFRIHSGTYHQCKTTKKEESYTGKIKTNETNLRN